MLKLEVFDPPMCCATGICGNNVDPKLVTFASDLEWLKKQGIDVVRYGLSFEPNKFVENETVKNTLQREGNDSLPILIADNQLVYKGIYPSREQLASACNINWKAEFATEETTKVEAEVCGPDCDCHKSSLSDNAKKVLFVLVVLTMLTVIAVKLSSNKAGAAAFYKNITSITQIKANEDVAFIYIPADGNKNIGSDTKNAMISAQNTLKAKGISTSLYLMNTKSSEYAQNTPQMATPGVLTIYKGKSKNYVFGAINQSKLLQSYMAATLAGGCGANCPCHKH